MNDLREASIFILHAKHPFDLLVGFKKTCVVSYCEKLLKQWNLPIRHASRNFSEQGKFLGIKQKFQ